MTGPVGVFVGILALAAASQILSRIFIGKRVPVEDEAEYLDRGDSADPFGPTPFLRAPLMPGLSWLLGGRSGESRLRAMSDLVSVLTILAVAFAGHISHGPLSAVACGVLLAFLPDRMMLGRHLWPDVWLGLWQSLLLGLLCWDSFRAPVPDPIFGLVAAAAVLTRIEALLVLPAVGLSLAAAREGTSLETLLLLSLPSVTVILGSILFNWRRYRIPLPDTTFLFNLTVMEEEQRRPASEVSAVESLVASAIRQWQGAGPGSLPRRAGGILLRRVRDPVGLLRGVAMRGVQLLGPDTYSREILLNPTFGVYPDLVPDKRRLLRAMARVTFPTLLSLAISAACVGSGRLFLLWPALAGLLAASLTHTRTRFRFSALPALCFLVADTWVGLDPGSRWLMAFIALCLWPVLLQLPPRREVNLASPPPGKDAHPDLGTRTNQFAPPPWIVLERSLVVVRGYQQFAMTAGSITPLPEDLELGAKHAALRRYFRPGVLRGKSVLDLGASAGFFSFWAAQSEATKVTALDLDVEYLQVIRRAADHLQIGSLHIMAGSVSDCSEPADVVLALAFVHWIHPSGGLDVAVGRLADLTRDLLIAEWISPDDPDILTHRHTGWNPDLVSGPYGLAEFEAALGKHFSRFTRLGAISPTRQLYEARKSALTIEDTDLLPAPARGASVLSCRPLCEVHGVTYWSRVSVDAGRIVKETSLELAMHEAGIYSRLEPGSRYFTRVLEVTQLEGTGRLVLERIEGVSLDEASDSLTAHRDDFARFILDCLNILGELRRAGIQHRDILASNLLVREGLPVLIDFGWAVSPDRAMVTPLELGRAGEPPCDVRSMGQVLLDLSGGRHPGLEEVLRFMTEPDPRLRMTDLDLLRALVEARRKADVDILSRLTDHLTLRDHYRHWLTRERDEARRAHEAATRDLEEFLRRLAR